MASATTTTSKQQWIFPLLLTLLIFFFLVVASTDMGLLSSMYSSNFAVLSKSVGTKATKGVFLESKLAAGNMSSRPLPVPRLAYLISGSKGDMERLWRTLGALYHPRNLYVVHLDLEEPEEERAELARRIKNETLFREMGNVEMIQKANMVTYRGPTMVSNTLHACAVLLRKSRDWDWFINLSASDYPLVTQDDLLYTFAKISRSTNFVEHTSRLGWKEAQRAKPVMVDPGLYSSTKGNVFFVRQKREMPTAFKLFTGSAWVALTRDFVEYNIWGYDNLPRTLLMYYANFVSSPEGYFHTVLCNAPSFNTTIANHDLHFISWDNPPRQHPRSLTINDTNAMIASNTPFARKFPPNDPALDKIDVELLRRRNGRFPPGGWCAGKPKCTKIGNTEKLRPGPGAKRLEILMSKIARPDLVARSCR